MHQNLPFHIGLYNSSETTDSSKPDQSGFHARPFSLSLANNSPLITRQFSARSFWTNSEKEKYSIFAGYFREVLQNLPIESMNWNVFKGMAKFVQTRNPQQCRSHHLKLIKEFQGIGHFLSHSVKRVRRLKRKMHEVLNILTEIQEEFQLYVEENEQIIRKNIVQVEDSITKLVEGELCFVGGQEKMDKEDLKKTADSYDEGQNPVKDNIFFSSLPQSNSFMSSKVKTRRTSLPSFDIDDRSPRNCINYNLNVQEEQRKPQYNLMSFQNSKMDSEMSQPNFDTFKVPEYIRTTSQMYKLWQNSYHEFGNDSLSSVIKSEVKESK